MTNASRPLFLSACAAVLLLGGPSPRAQGGLVPLGGEQLVNVVTDYQQEWGKVALAADGTRFAVAYGTVISNDVLVRFYDGDGAPTSGELLVNAGFKAGIQDEPMAAVDAAGNVIVCWSDRNNYDGGTGGGNMGCFARVYGADGVPLGTPFQVNQEADESQWEPMPSALPGGGWVVAFNGDSDGNAYLRFFDLDGTPRTGDVSVNTVFNNGQVDAECAVLPDGSVLAVYSDYGGNVQAGTGTNLLARRFNMAGVPQMPSEMVVNENTLAFDQIEPRVASSGLGYGLGGFAIVWQDAGNDGDGWGVYARLYDALGAPRGPEFPVNQTTTGDQLLPEVAMDHVGNLVVTWEDHASGDGRIMARRFDRDGQPFSDEFVVSGGLPGDYHRPQVALDDAGETVVFAYGGPGNDGAMNNDEDVYLRRFAFRPITVVGAPAVGGTFELALDLPGGAGDLHVLLASFADAPGLPLPDGRVLPLAFDGLFVHSLSVPDGGLPFDGFQGLLPDPPQATAGVTLPNNAGLVGLPLHFAVLTLDPAYGSLLFQLRHVTHDLEVVLE